MSPRRDRKLETTTREKSPEKNGFSTSELLIAGFGRLGGGDGMDRTGCPPPSHRTSLGFLSQERKFSKQRFKRRNRPVCRVLVRKDHTISRVRGAQPPSHRTSLEPESGTGIFTAEIEVEHLRWFGQRLRATRRDYGADAAASNQLNRQFNSPSGPVRASISLSARVVVFSL